MKKLICILLILAITLSSVLLVACGKAEEEGSDKGDVLGDESKMLSTAFGNEHLTFDNEDFLVMTKNDHTANNSWNVVDLVVEDNLGDDTIKMAVQKRNDHIETAFKIKIKRQQSTDLLNEASLALQKQDDSYDSFMICIRDGLTLALTGAMMDYSDQDYIDLSSEWWDQGVVDNMALLGGQYLALGDVNTIDDDATWCVLFNKVLLDSYGYTSEELYNKVYSGDNAVGGFTTEYLTGIAKKAYKQDPNHSNKWENSYAGSGTYGLFLQKEVAIALLQGSGNTPTRVDNSMAGVSPMVFEESFADAVDKIFDFMGNKDTADWYLVLDNISDGTDDKWANTVRPAFMADKVAFYITPFDTIHHFRDMKSDFGILPMPKISEDQLEYGTTIQYGNATCYVTPYRVDEYLNDKSAYILEAMCYYSSPEYLGEECLKYAHYTLTLQAKGTRDDASWEMMDFILKKRVFDVACALNLSGINTILQNMAVSAANNWISDRDSQLGNMASELGKKLEILAKG